MTDILKPDFSGGEVSPNPDFSENVQAGPAELNSDHDNGQQLVDEKSPNWLKRNMLKLSLGGFVVGTTVGIATSPFEEVKQTLTETAPWVAGGLAASEALWVGGAGLMAAGAGRKVGNPLKIRGRWNEIAAGASRSVAFKSGLAINTVGAIGTAGVITAGAVEALPPTSWPGAAALVGLDVASTVAIRTGIYKGLKQAEGQVPASPARSEKKEAKPKVTVRAASIEDIDRLADIDLSLFKRAYGDALPEKQAVITMLTKRYNNCPDWMFVTEVNGKVEGFVSAFPTNKSADDFESWEKSTNDGTLDGKVAEDGKYAYVTNMTIGPEAVKAGAMDMLLGQLIAKGIEHGVEYGYFESRMPMFKYWLKKELGGTSPQEVDAVDLESKALQFMNTTRDDGKRYDVMLRMYEEMGFKLTRVVPGAFEDDASLNFGVICLAEIPPVSPRLKSIKAIRHGMAAALRLASKHPKSAEVALKI